MSDSIRADSLIEEIRGKVLKEVKAALSDMKPDIINKISNNIKRELEPLYKDIEQKSKANSIRANERINELENRMTALEKLLTKSSSSSAINGSPIVKSSSASAIQGTGLIKCGSEYIIKPDKNARKVEIRDGRVNGNYSSVRFDGWLFYNNHDMADFLYMVREDGYYNTQVTDYRVWSVEVSKGYVCFDDCNYNEIRAKIVD